MILRTDIDVYVYTGEVYFPLLYFVFHDEIAFFHSYLFRRQCIFVVHVLEKEM